MKIAKPLRRAIQESDAKALAPIDDSPIHEWSEKHVNLRGAYAISGRFRVGKSQYIIPILDAFKNHSVREICLLASTQGGKSLCMDLSLVWTVANRPGPSMFIMQSNQVAEEHASGRLIPTLRDTPAVKEYLPSYRRMSKDCIDFSHMPLYIHGPGERRLQSKSIMNIFCSELWQWDAGVLDWARKRTKHFYKYGMSKVFLESQGGTEDSDLDIAFKRGSMKIFHVPCPHCKELFVPDIAHMNCDGKKWNDPKLDIKDEKGSYDYGKLEEVLTMECPKCHGRFKDSESIRVLWGEEGKYIQMNPTPLRGHESFSWNSFICDPWFDIVYEFIEATRMLKKGSNENLLNFFRQRLAKNISLESIYVQDKFVPTSDYNPLSPYTEDQFGGIFFAIDVQENKYVAVIRAFDKEGNSKQLWFGTLFSADEIETKRVEWNIPPHCVVIDSGGQRTRETYGICAERGYLAFKGVAEKKGFRKPYKTPSGQARHAWHFWKRSEEAGDPAMGTPQQGKVKKASLYLICVNPVKDILSRLRDRKSNLKWECLDATKYDLTEYNRQMYSEYKKKTINRYGATEEYWVKVKHDLPNDYWDVENYIVAMALMSPFISLSESFHAPSSNKPDLVREDVKDITDVSTNT
jgi:hypothetical protein